MKPLSTGISLHLTKLTGLDTNTYPLTIGKQIYFLESQKIKIEPKYLPMWEVNFGPRWKVTYMLKGLSKKLMYKK